MKALFALLSFSIAVVLLSSGCIVTSGQADIQSAIEKCQAKCYEVMQTATDVSKGPCLSDSIINDWACDMVNNPRYHIDDLPENQCPGLGTTAHHFVEVNENCRVVRVV
jgi:hypothetical protein